MRIRSTTISWLFTVCYLIILIVAVPTFGGAAAQTPTPPPVATPPPLPLDPPIIDLIPTETPTQTASPTAEVTADPTQTTTPTADVTEDPTPTADPTQTPTPTADPTFTPTHTPTADPTSTQTTTPTPTSTPTPTLTPTGTPVTGCYASHVIRYRPGSATDGGMVQPAFANPGAALGAPDDNYTALGIFGELVVRFSPNPIMNVPGADFRVVETTSDDHALTASDVPERAQVYASQDGIVYSYLGLATRDTWFDLGTLTSARYIRIMDMTNTDLYPPGTTYEDGFDVDSVAAAQCGPSGFVIIR